MAIVYDAHGVAGKVCNKCGEWKLVSEFSPHRFLRGDGYEYTCKICLRAIRRAYYATNHEKFNAKQRAYYQAHREEIIAANRAYRETNPEKVKATNRAYYYRNQEQRKRAQRVRNVRQRALQPEQVRAYYRVYYRTLKQTDPKKLRRWQRKHEHRRRNRKNHAEGFHTEAEWEALKARYDYTCLYCGLREPEITLTRDHIVPLIQGGSDWITNLQPLCGSCNSSKNDRIVDYRVNWIHKTDGSFYNPLPPHPNMEEGEER